MMVNHNQRIREYDDEAGGDINVEAKQDQELAEHCRTSCYTRRKNLISFVMKLSNLKLVAEESSSASTGPWQCESHVGALRRPPLVCNILRPSGWPETMVAPMTDGRRPGKVVDVENNGGRRRRTNFWHTLGHRLVQLVFCACYAKQGFLSILLLRRDSLISWLGSKGPTTNGGVLSAFVGASFTTTTATTNTTTTTATTSDGRKEARAELESLTRLLQWAGVGYLSIHGLATLMSTLGSLLPFLFHFSSQLYLSHHKVRASSLCFIFDPIGERRRIKADLNGLVRELIGSLSNRQPPPPPPLASGSPATHTANRYSVAPRHKQPTSVRLENSRFIHLLMLINRLQLVRPYNMTCYWHRTLVKIVAFGTEFFAILTWGLTTVIFFLLVATELCAMARLRLEVAHEHTAAASTNLWSAALNATAASGAGQPSSATGSVVSVERLHLGPLNWSSPEWVAYKSAQHSYDGSFKSLVHLALTVESASYFTFRRVLYLAEIYTGFSQGCFEAAITGALLLGALTDKIVWLRQLDQQASRALDEAVEHAERKARPQPAAGDETTAAEHDQRLLKSLTVIYLNYELFRRQESDFQALACPLLARLLLLLASGGSVFYLAAVNSRNLVSLYIALIWSLVVLFMINMSLLTWSYKEKQVETLLGKVASFVAHCSGDNGPRTTAAAAAAVTTTATSVAHHLSYPIELWRRQLECDTKARQFNPPRSPFIGWHITYGNVISLNAYAIILIVVITRLVYSHI